jgi:hypothetical protein
MVRTVMMLMAAAAVGCGGKGDDCQQFVDKAKPWLDKMAKDAGRPFGDAEQKQLLEMCRTKPQAKEAQEFKCVMAAKDDAAVAACFEVALKDYMGKSKATEAAINLNKIGKNLKVVYLTNAAIPAGKAGPKPAKPCCEGPDHKCPVENWLQDPVWADLDFEVFEPSQFQYTYESTDPNKATATAIGDLDCDGTTITYTLEATVKDGNPEVKITKPTTAD